MEKNSLSDAKIASKTTYWVYQMDNPWHYQVHTNKFCSTAIKSTHQLGNSLEHLAIRNNRRDDHFHPSSQNQQFLLFTLTLQIPVKMRPILVRGTSTWTLRMTTIWMLTRYKLTDTFVYVTAV